MARIRLPGRSPKSPPPPLGPIEEEIDELLPDDDGEGARMGFFEHLDELRQRITRAAIALVIGSLIGIAAAQPALEYLVTPYCTAVKDNVIVTDEGANGSAVITDSDCRLV